MKLLEKQKKSKKNQKQPKVEMCYDPLTLTENKGSPAPCSKIKKCPWKESGKNWGWHNCYEGKLKIRNQND